MPLTGERRALHGPLWMYEAEMEPRDSDSYMPSKLSLWNSSTDTQYRVTFTCEEPNITVLGAKELEPGKVQALLYPGQAMEVFEGSYARHSVQMQFGTPDQDWLDKQALAESKDVVVEIEAVKAILKNNPTPDGKYTADYVANLCESYNLPFVDLTFPPKASPSLFREFEESPFKKNTYPWKRPHNYIKDPEKNPPGLWVGKIEPADIDQGSNGTCYLCCALAGLAEKPARIEKMFQARRNPDLGIYRVIMCKAGWRHLVTVDDLLPTRNGTPTFAKNRHELNELWVSLLEKCYAKIYCSFQAISGGSPPHAVADCIGTPFLRFRDHPGWDQPDKEDLFRFLERADREGAIITISTPGSDTTDYAGTGAGGFNTSAEQMAEKYKKVGLVAGHAFTVLAVRRYQNHRLMCIRNPWGCETEWNGRWCDNDPNWTPEMKRELSMTNEKDGTFWMDFMDVIGPKGWFDGGAVNYCLEGWSCVRVAGNYDNGVPDVIMRITVAPGSQPVRVHMGVHQKDTRGMRPDEEKANKYVAVLNAFVRPHPPGSEHARGYCDIVAQSGDSFMSARDVFCETVLEPCASASMPYYAVPLCYSDVDRSFVTSLWFSSVDNVTVEFVSFKDGLAKRVMHPANFVPSQCTQKVNASIQLERPQFNGRWVNLECHLVDWAAQPGDLPSRDALKTVTNPASAVDARARAVKLAEGGQIDQVNPLRETVAAGAASVAVQGALASQPSFANPASIAQQRIAQAAVAPAPAPILTPVPTAQPARQETPAQQPQPTLARPQSVDPAGAVRYGGTGGGGLGGPLVTGPAAGVPAANQTRPQQQQPTPAPSITTTRPLDIVVTAVSGSGLVARDVNGKSDPYLTVSVQDGNKVPRAGLPPQSTPYDSKTLDPVWAHPMRFRGVNPTDIFEVSVWDKDFIGRDEFMGSVLVPVRALDLTTANRSKKGEFRLTGNPPLPLPFLPPITWAPGMGNVTGSVTLTFKLE